MRSAQSPGAVVVNEFVYDLDGFDILEFVELYNTTSASIDMTGWSFEWDQWRGAPRRKCWAA